MGESDKVTMPDKLQIYCGNKRIDAKVLKMENFSCDFGEEGGDKTGVSIWHHGSISVHFTIAAEDNPLGKWYWGMVRRFNREKEALFYALTHGYVIRISVHDEEGDEGYFELDRPSQLRTALRKVKFIPEYKIYDKRGKRYLIKKGKLSKMPSF